MRGFALPTVLMLAGCATGGYAPVETVPIAALGPRNVPAPPPAPPLSLSGPAVQGGMVPGTARSDIVRLTLGDVDVPIAPDRAFLIAFDRDSPASADLVAARADGSTIRETLAVAPRAWRIERLDTLPRVPVPDAAFARVRPGELAQIAAARATPVESQGWRGPFAWPVTGRISGLFGAQRVYRGEPGSYHSGVDVAAAAGVPILAPADGVVTLAADRPFTLEGNLVIVDHGMGLSSAFLHLSRIDVRVGERVARGRRLGSVGATGRATGPHLHWGMTWRGRRLDPLLAAGPMSAPAENR